MNGDQSPRTPGVPVFKATSSKPKGICLNREAKLLCAWPRCHCNIDLVYMTDCRIQRPHR